MSVFELMFPNNKRIAVIGGGISGLAAAIRLRDQSSDVDITLFEAGPRLGGVMQTEEVDGYCLEHGPDSLLSRMPSGVAFCQRLGLSDELISTSPAQRGVHVVCRGKLQRVPDGLSIMAPQKIWPFVTTPILSWPGKLRLAAEPFLPRRQGTEEETLARFSRRRLGGEFYDRLVQPLAGGIYMGDPEKLSVQATFPQFAQMEQQHGSLARAAWNDRKKAAAAAPQSGPQYSLFVAPRHGAAQLIDAAGQELQRLDCVIRCEHQVHDLRRTEDNRWVLRFSANASPSQEETFDGVLFALPTYHSASIVRNVAPDLAHELEQFPYEGCVVVNLAFDRDAIRRPLDSFGFVAPYVENQAILACTYSSIKYSGRAPDGQVLIRSYLGGARQPEALDWSDENVLGTVQGELNQLLGVSKAPVLSRIQRWKRAMPQYYVGHQDRVTAVEMHIADLPGIEMTSNAFRGVGIPHCIREGNLSADRMLAYLQQSASHQDQTVN